MAKLPKWVWILGLGVALTAPMLGSFGLWDPAEIKHADVAREVAEKGSFFDVTVGGKYAPRTVLNVWLIALGFKLFGINELAGRLPLLLVGLLGLFWAYQGTKRLFGEEAGLAAGFILATTPAFLFQMRQLTSDVSFYTGLLGAVGGFAAYLAPIDGKRQRNDLIVGGIGLVMAALGRGVLVGVGVPLIGIVSGSIIAYAWRQRGVAQTNLDVEANGHAEPSVMEKAGGGTEAEAEAGTEAEAVTEAEAGTEAEAVTETGTETDAVEESKGDDGQVGEKRDQASFESDGNSPKGDAEGGAEFLRPPVRHRFCRSIEPRFVGSQPP